VEGCRKNCHRSTNFCKVRESHNEAYLNHIILFLLYRLCKKSRMESKKLYPVREMKLRSRWERHGRQHGGGGGRRCQRGRCEG
jgi:hypothetical protein